MEPGSKTDGSRRDAPPATLGDVLFAGRAKPRVSEAEWLGLVRSVAAGDQGALQVLYARTHRIVYTLGVRITGNRETAEEVALDVFHDVWRRASAYDPANGSVVGWIMNLARSRAIDRVRFEQRKKRVAPPTDTAASTLTGANSEPHDELQRRDEEGLLREALKGLAQEERQAIETAYFSELSYADAAERLGQPVGTIKTRIRTGLRKLRRALRASDESERKT